MTSDPRTPFRVAGGECRDIINQCAADDQAARLAQGAFAEKYGCHQYRVCSSIHTLICDGEIPDGWMHRKRDPQNEIVPKTKAIREEMQALPHRVDSFEFARRLGCPLAPEGSKIYWPYTETVGELSILWIPNAALRQGYRPPSGAEEMKMSDYWHLKEQAGDAE